MFEKMISILGKNLHDVEVANFISTLGDKPEVMGMDITYYIFKQKGMNLVFDENLALSSIQLYPQGVDGYDEYKGGLPQDMSFQTSRDEVRAKFGSPTNSGGGETLPILGLTRHWDRYDFGTYTLHFEYQVGEGSITLMTLGAKPDSPIQ